MHPFKRNRRGIPTTKSPSRLEAELREEMRFYLDMRADELMGDGLRREEAIAMAEDAFGDSEALIAQCLTTYRQGRSRRSIEIMQMIGQDIRQASRFVRRAPMFAGIAVLTLALGIGLNTAIFSVVNGVLLKPPPYQSAETLVTVSTVWDDHPGGVERDAMAPPDVADLAERSPSVVSLVGYQPLTVTLTGMGDPELIAAIRVSGGLLGVFGLQPVLGRDINADEHGYGAPRIAVISYEFWRTRFSMGIDAIGRQVELNEAPFEIVGVAPEGFGFPGRTSVWIPHRFNSPEGLSRSSHTWQTIGRVADGTDIVAAQSEIDAIASALSGAYPESNAEKGFMIESLHERMVSQVRTELVMLLGTVAVVLLIACANVANMLLVRASERVGEIAVRAALGASRRRLAVQILTETSVLAAAGGGLGIAMALAGVQAFRVGAAGTIPRMNEVSVDGPVLLFTLGLVIVVTVVAGLSPILHMLGASPTANLTHAGRGSGSKGMGHHFRRFLLGFEVALSVVLLAGAGLLLRTFQQLHSVDLGFETQEVVRFSLVKDGSLDEVRTFYRRLEERISTLPGVESVGSVYGAPLGPAHTTAEVSMLDKPALEPGRETYAGIRAVSPEYLATAGIPLVRGRSLSPSDDVSPQAVALVNERFVVENFPGEEPIGQRVRMLTDFGHGIPTLRIVGVVRDIRSESLKQEPIAEIYVPHGHLGAGFMTVTVRSMGEVESLVPAIRAEVLALDSRQPLRGVETLEDAIRREVAPTRFFMMMALLFAGLALMLATVGLYGVLSYLVTQRREEIGIRAALGASEDKIVRMVVTEGLRIVILGAAAGLAVALWSGRLLNAFLFNVEPWDPRTFVAVIALLLAVSVLASVLPARRASRVDPIEALRTD